jgi:hypothetical protein
LGAKLGIMGAETVDDRLHKILMKLKAKVSESELQAFARFIAAVARTAHALQVDNVFREGRSVRARDFQQEMQRGLRADAALTTWWIATAERRRYAMPVRNNADDRGIKTKTGPHSSGSETFARLRETVRDKGLEVFALVDHSGAAERVGLEIQEAKS